MNFSLRCLYYTEMSNRLEDSMSLFSKAREYIAQMDTRGRGIVALICVGVIFLFFGLILTGFFPSCIISIVEGITQMEKSIDQLSKFSGLFGGFCSNAYAVAVFVVLTIVALLTGCVAIVAAILLPVTLFSNPNPNLIQEKG